MTVHLMQLPIPRGNSHFWYLSGHTIEANDRVSNAALIKATVYEQEDSANVGRIELKNYANITGSVDEAVLDPIRNFTFRLLGLNGLNRR